MIRFNITVDNDLLEQVVKRMPHNFDQRLVPATVAALNEAALYIRDIWRGWAMGGPIKGIKNIKHPSSKLYESIHIEENGPFNVFIRTDSPYAQRIQEGTPRLDMKTTHPYGKKSRITKSGPHKGKPYLIVPFRWGTPNDAGGARAHFGPTYIVPELYEITKHMKKSRRTGETHSENNYRGEAIQRSEYQWGGRLKTEGKSNGMVRMDDKTTKGSTYFTFRIISEAQRDTKPNSWIRKEVKKIDVVSALIKMTKPTVDKLIQDSLREDIWNLTH
jgi:hypothetical protein